MPVLNPLETAVADQMERDSRDAVRDVRRMMAATRKLRLDRAECSVCGDVFPAKALSNVNSGISMTPRWVCVDCLYGKVGN